MKQILTFTLLLFTFWGQAQKAFNIKGIVEDTTGNVLISSTVLLLNKADSTMVEFTRSGMDGSFIFRKIPAGNYLIKTTYVGYIPLTVDASSQGDNVDLGVLKMAELAKEFMEIVIKAAKAPIKMKGDTIEYDASTFQVPQGSTVEELLRQLPGIEIEEDGSIQAEGRTVDRVTVDGKKFFGNDPKAATKNLPAEGISKVQVFDTKTEADKVTGTTGEAESKTMNLELKDAFKKGSFGRVVAGVGTESRGEIKGNINRFNKKVQFSLVGVGNNTGRNGLGWNDYQDFMGSQSFSFSSDGDYGFGTGGNFFITFGGGGGNALERDIQSVFFSGGDNGGFPTNYNGGINFNYNHDKTEFSSVYYYNQAGLEKFTSNNTTSFFQDFSSLRASGTSDDDISSGHRAEISLDQKIDSLHSFRIDINAAYINENNESVSDISLFRDESLTTVSSFDNDLRSNGFLFNSALYFRKAFKKKGRRFGANAVYLTTQLDKFGNQLSTTDFKDNDGITVRSQDINQITENLAGKTQYKLNAVYVEPIAKKFFSQTFINYSQRFENGDRTVEDEEDGSRTINSLLSRTYENDISQSRLGTAFRYSHNGVNVSVGGAFQQFVLRGNFQAKGIDFGGMVDNTFNIWVPHFAFNTRQRGSYISFDYGLSAQEPNIDDLQAIIDNSNPLYIREGNPDLTPEVSHRINARYRKNWALSQVRFNINSTIQFYTNNIINEETVDEDLITTVKPINFRGGERYSVYTSVNFPIVPRKLKMNVQFSSSLNNSFAIVNSFENKTTTWSYSPSTRLTFTPKKDISLSLNGNWRFADTRYEINESQDQQTLNTRYSISANSILFWKFYINSSFNYQNTQNERFGFNQSVPILNASIYRQFLPGNKLEIRIAIYDAFNQNRRINQFANGNRIVQSEITSLGRYIMLSATYNIKGLKTDVNRNRWF